MPCARRQQNPAERAREVFNPKAFWPAWLRKGLSGRRSKGRKHLGRHLAQPHAVALPLAPTTNGDPVAVLEKCAALASAELDRPRALPRQFQEAAEGIGRRPADGSRREKIAGAQVAAVDGVMSYLLEDVPVEMPSIGRANPLRLRHLRRL